MSGFAPEAALASVMNSRRLIRETKKTIANDTGSAAPATR
jgi:hypothetical protein